MKWMGWDERAWYEAPPHLTDRIIQMVRAEQEELERIRAKNS